MKNIIWQQPGGAIGVYTLADDADSEAVAAQLLASGQVDPSWTAALFDVQEFPGPPQETWVIVEGVLTTDEVAKAAWDLEEKRRIGRALIDDLERKFLMPKLLRVTIMSLAEREAIAYGATEDPPLTPAQSIALLQADTDSGYYRVRALHQELETIRVEHEL